MEVVAASTGEISHLFGFGHHVCAPDEPNDPNRELTRDGEPAMPADLDLIGCIFPR